MTDMRHQQNFLSKLDGLIESFPGLKSKGKIDRIYSFLKNLPDRAIDEIFNTVLDNFKYTPTPNDFHEAAIAWKKKNNFSNETIDAVFTKIECDFCYDTGIIKVEHHEPDGFKKLLRCDCSIGISNKDLLPGWNNELKSVFIRKPIDPTWFNPQIQETDTDVKIYSKIWSKVKDWRKSVKLSEKYWRELGYKGEQNAEV